MPLRSLRHAIFKPAAPRQNAWHFHQPSSAFRRTVHTAQNARDKSSQQIDTQNAHVSSDHLAIWLPRHFAISPSSMIYISGLTYLAQKSGLNWDLNPGPLTIKQLTISQSKNSATELSSRQCFRNLNSTSIDDVCGVGAHEMSEELIERHCADVPAR